MFWDTAQYFHSKTLRKSVEKIFSLKFVQVGYKRPQKNSNKYCNLLFHASFTKFTGPAKLFLSNNIFYFQTKKMWILVFFWRWSLQRCQLNKSPCGCKKKNVTKSIKKTLPNFVKLDPMSCHLIPVIFIKRYTRSIIFVMFRWKLSNSWIYLWKKLFGDSLKMSTKYCVTKSEKKKNIKRNFPFLQNMS